MPPSSNPPPPGLRLVTDLATGLVKLLETLHPESFGGHPAELQFHDAFFYIITTFSSVG